MANVFYEEAGTLKVGSVLTDNTTSLQIESIHGKRSKIKAKAILLRFETPPAHEFMQQVQAIAAAIDVNFLWECCEENTEFSGQKLAADYFGHAPTPIEIAAIFTLLKENPIYFHKKGTDYRAAPPEILQAALAGREKKRLAEEKQAGYVQQLLASELPDTFKPILNDLLYKPDKNTIEWKALEAASIAAKMSILKLLEQCGAIPSSHDYHFNQFLYEHFPQGTDFAVVPSDSYQVDLEAYPLADVTAFSIDDAATTEIDDAFSVTSLANSSFRIGIHIATPALIVTPDSPLDEFAAQRLSTIYLPGHKITMLPEHVIQHFTLSEACQRPVLSLYLEVTDDFTVTQTFSRLETIEIAANLRLDRLEQQFNETTLHENQADYPFAHELKTLWNFSNAMEKSRGKDQDNNLEKIDYNFTITDQDRIVISERRRGAPVDKIVSELMIFANAEWGKQLADAGFAGIYRSQGNGKVKMSLSPAPHQGLGVAQYTWSSSPMRRYIDLVNQRQLIALTSGNDPIYAKEDDAILIAMRNFEIAYTAYVEFQRGMERYWCLRWLLQENIDTIGATIIKESLVKLDHLPLITRVPSLPDLPLGERVTIGIAQIDLLDRTLNASFLGKCED